MSAGRLLSAGISALPFVYFVVAIVPALACAAFLGGVAIGERLRARPASRPERRLRLARLDRHHGRETGEVEHPDDARRGVADGQGAALAELRDAAHAR